MIVVKSAVGLCSHAKTIMVDISAKHSTDWFMSGCFDRVTEAHMDFTIHYVSEHLTPVCFCAQENETKIR